MSSPASSTRFSTLSLPSKPIIPATKISTVALPFSSQSHPTCLHTYPASLVVATTKGRNLARGKLLIPVLEFVLFLVWLLFF